MRGFRIKVSAGSRVHLPAIRCLYGEALPDRSDGPLGLELKLALAAIANHQPVTCHLGLFTFASFKTTTPSSVQSMRDAASRKQYVVVMW